jgi:hypothetical protein
MIKKLLYDILTTGDNQTFDNGRVLATLVIVCFLLFTGCDVVLTHTFEYEQFGIGIGATFAGVGLNLKLKENSEPKP